MTNFDVMNEIEIDSGLDPGFIKFQEEDDELLGEIRGLYKLGKRPHDKPGHRSHHPAGDRPDGERLPHLPKINTSLLYETT